MLQYLSCLRHEDQRSTLRAEVLASSPSSTVPPPAGAPPEWTLIFEALKGRVVVLERLAREGESGRGDMLNTLGEIQAELDGRKKTLAELQVAAALWDFGDGTLPNISAGYDFAEWHARARLAPRCPAVA